MNVRKTDPETGDQPETAFRLWHLLGVIGVVMLLLMGVAALVNVLVLGYHACGGARARRWCQLAESNRGPTDYESVA